MSWRLPSLNGTMMSTSDVCLLRPGTAEQAQRGKTPGVVGLVATEWVVGEALAAEQVQDLRDMRSRSHPQILETRTYASSPLRLQGGVKGRRKGRRNPNDVVAQQNI